MAERFLPTRCWFAGRVRRVLRRMVWLLKRVSEVEGTDFRDAQPSQDQNGRPNIRFNLNYGGRRPFYKYTAPTRHQAPRRARWRLCWTTRFVRLPAFSRRFATVARSRAASTQQQANDLSLMLRTGALPASISFLETRTVGPTLVRRRFIRDCCRDCRHAGGHGLHAGLLPRGGHQCDLALMLNLDHSAWFMGYTGSASVQDRH